MGGLDPASKAGLQARPRAATARKARERDAESLSTSFGLKFANCPPAWSNLNILAANRRGCQALRSNERQNLTSHPLQQRPQHH
jgi:hypothetical protein